MFGDPNNKGLGAANFDAKGITDIECMQKVREVAGIDEGTSTKLFIKWNNTTKRFETCTNAGEGSQDNRLQSGDETKWFLKWDGENTVWRATILSDFLAALGISQVSTDHSVIPTGLKQFCIDTGVMYYSIASGQNFVWAEVLPAATGSVKGAVKIGARLTMTGEVLSADPNFPGATPVNAVSSTALLTSSNVNPTDGDIIIVSSVSYKFETTPSVVNDVLKGANADETLDNLISAINTGATGGKCYTGTVHNPDVTAAGRVGHTVTMSAKVKGTIGNDIVKGITTGATYSWNAGTKFSGGVNGTVGTAGQFCFDANYIWTCKAVNTIADANWSSIPFVPVIAGYTRLGQVKVPQYAGLDLDSEGNLVFMIDTLKGLKYNVSTGVLEVNLGTGLQFNAITGAIELSGA